MIDKLLESTGSLCKYDAFCNEVSLSELDIEYVRETEEALKEYYEFPRVVLVLEDKASMTSLVYVTEEDYDVMVDEDGVYIVNAKVYSDYVPNGEYGSIGIRYTGKGIERVY